MSRKCWWSKDELICNILQLTPTYWHTSGGWPAKSYIHQAHIREEQNPGEVTWAFQWCTKPAIFYQWPGHWTTATSPSGWVTQCHTNPGESSDNYPAVKYPDLTQFLWKSIRRVDQHWRVNFWPSVNWYGWKNNYCRTSRTLPLSIITNRKGTDRHVIITAEYPYFQFKYFIGMMKWLVIIIIIANDHVIEEQWKWEQHGLNLMFFYLIFLLIYYQSDILKIWWENSSILTSFKICWKMFFSGVGIR